MCFAEDALGPSQPRQEPSWSSSSPNDGSLAFSECSCPLGELIRAEELAANRTGDEIVAIISGEPGQDAGEDARPRCRRSGEFGTRSSSGNFSRRHTARYSQPRAALRSDRGSVLLFRLPMLRER